VGTEKRERQKANRALKHQQEVQAVARRKLYRKIAIGVAGVAALVLFVWIASTIVGDDDEPTTPVTVPAVDTTVESTTDTTVASTTETTGG
jgi:ferric-dicitrate binding protein FerR (iron transport regulator)